MERIWVPESATAANCIDLAGANPNLSGSGQDPGSPPRCLDPASTNCIERASPWGPIAVCDAHVHFLSDRFFELLAAQGQGHSGGHRTSSSKIDGSGARLAAPDPKRESIARIHMLTTGGGWHNSFGPQTDWAGFRWMACASPLFPARCGSTSRFPRSAWRADCFGQVPSCGESRYVQPVGMRRDQFLT